jgi:polyhydroxyalkanoate synthase subunit PhaC
VKSVNIHGYCLGGTLSAVYTALKPENVKNLLLQAAPIDFNTDNALALWARNIEPTKLTAAFHQAPGEMLNLGFLLADPINLIIGKYSGFLDMIESETGMKNFLRMDNWIFDSPAMSEATYNQYINDWYHNNLIVKKQFRALGETVDLAKIECPVLVLAAKFDHIVPPSSQKAILDYVSSKDASVLEMAKGHIGITTSRESHREFWPKVLMWLEERSDPCQEATPPVKKNKAVVSRKKAATTKRVVRSKTALNTGIKAA